MYEYQAKLVRVIDGDTYELCVDLGFGVRKVDKFRLYGVDTPEKFGRNACEEGELVSVFVKQLLEAQPEWFTIQTYKDRQGKYGRYLVDIFLSTDEEGRGLTSTRLSEYLVFKNLATRI